MNEIDKEIKDAAVIMGRQTCINAKEIAVALRHIAVIFGASVSEHLQESLVHLALNSGVSPTMTSEELATALNCMEPHRQETKTDHKLSFNRPRIVHQVSNRRPRNLIKKIIR